MNQRALVFVVSVLACGFGPCSGGDPGNKTDKDESEQKKKKKNADEDEEMKPADLVKKNTKPGWSGTKSGVGNKGAKWKIDVWNCGKDPKGPWKGYFSMDASQSGITMSGESTEWPPFTFKNDTDAVASVVKVKVKATGAGVNMNLDSATNIELTFQPETSITIKEKAATGGVTAKGPQGETASWFGGGEGKNTEVITIAPGCDENFVPAPLVPPTPAPKKK